MSRHALPWSLWAMYRDSSARTQPGRHAANYSPTHQPAWPFLRRTA
jgi:hypothetical protein